MAQPALQPARPRRRLTPAVWWLAASSLAIAVSVTAYLWIGPPILPSVRVPVVVLLFAPPDADGRASAEQFSKDMAAALTRANPDHLEVFLRTTGMSGDPVKDADQLRQERRVEFALHGTFRQAGHRVQLTVHLMGISPPTDVWQETYDRDSSELPLIERDIAVKVARVILLP